MRYTYLVLICYSFFNLKCIDERSQYNERDSSGKKVLGKVNFNIDSLAKDGRYDSLYATFECEDSEYESRKKSIEVRIDSLLDTLQVALKNCNKDSIKIDPLIKLLAKEQASYKSDISESADLIFWSYGVASMTGERVVARKCYYLKELEKRYSFYLVIYDKVKGAVLDV